MIDKLIDLAVIICVSVLALGVYCCFVVSGKCSDEEPVDDDDRRYSGLLTEED